MKKFFVFLPIFLASFFLLLPNVKADTYNLTFNSTVFDILNDTSYLSIYSSASAYCEQNNCTFMITRESNGTYTLSQYFTGSSTITFNKWGGSGALWGYPTGGTWRDCQFNSEGTLLSSCRENQTMGWSQPGFQFTNSTISIYTFIYSNIPSSVFSLSSSNINNVYIISYENFTGTYSSTYPYIPPLYDIYLINNPPASSDNTPLLTNFIDISIEKLAVICNFITSSYIYLTPFVILIFYFVILLFRRLK